MFPSQPQAVFIYNRELRSLNQRAARANMFDISQPPDILSKNKILLSLPVSQQDIIFITYKFFHAIFNLRNVYSSLHNTYRKMDWQLIWQF